MATVAALPSRAELIDEYGELDRRIKALAPAVKRHKDLAEQIREWHAKLPPGETAVAQGNLWDVQVGACGNERSIGMAAKVKLFAMLKKKRFLELVHITLKAIETAPELGEAVLERLATVDQTGSRKLVAVPKGPVEAVKAA